MTTYTTSPKFEYDQVMSASGHLNALKDNAETLFDASFAWNPGVAMTSIGRHARSNGYDLDTAPHSTEDYLDADPQQFDFFEAGWLYNPEDAQYAGFYLVDAYAFKMTFPYLILRYTRQGPFDWQVRFYKVNPAHDRDDWDAQPYELSYTYDYTDNLSGLYTRVWVLASVPALNLQVGDYYRMEIWNKVDHDTSEFQMPFGPMETPWWQDPNIGKSQDTEVMRAFTDADCVANGTPGAADWQALSNNLDIINRDQAPVIGYRMIHTKGETSGLRHLVTSLIDADSLRLYYKVRGTSSSSNDRRINIYLVGDYNYHYELASFLIPSKAAEQTFEGFIDLSSYSSLVVDFSLKIRVFCQGETVIEALYAAPPETYPAAWNALPDWQHNSPVLGDGGVELLRNNIQWLVDNQNTRNFGCPKVFRHNIKARYEDFGVSTGFRFRRRKRFLHYYYDPVAEQTDGDEEWYDAETPGITFIKAGVEEETSLDVDDEDRPGWYIVDLDSVDGLFPSMWYTVKGCAFAFEEDISIEQGALLSA